jgi:hypothetical protein
VNCLALLIYEQIAKSQNGKMAKLNGKIEKWQGLDEKILED